MQLNSFTAECRIVKQSGIRELPSDRHVCNFTVVHDGLKEKAFFNCSFFHCKSRVELLSSLKPGHPVLLTGKLDPETYKDKPGFKFNVYDFQLPLSNANNNSIGNATVATTAKQEEQQETVDPPSDTDDVPF